MSALDQILPRLIAAADEWEKLGAPAPSQMPGFPPTTKEAMAAGWRTAVDELRSGKSTDANRAQIVLSYIRQYSAIARSDSATAERQIAREEKRRVEQAERRAMAAELGEIRKSLGLTMEQVGAMTKYGYVKCRNAEYAGSYSLAEYREMLAAYQGLAVLVGKKVGAEAK